MTYEEAVAAKFAPGTILDLGERSMKLTKKGEAHKFHFHVDVSGATVASLFNRDLAVEWMNVQRPSMRNAEEMKKRIGKEVTVKLSKIKVALGTKPAPLSATRKAHYNELINEGVITAEALMKAGKIENVDQLK